jgi:hypothetical protein
MRVVARLIASNTAIPNLIYLAVDKADVCKKSLKIYRSDLESASHLGKKRQGVRNVLDYQRTDHENRAAVFDAEVHISNSCV